MLAVAALIEFEEGEFFLNFPSSVTNSLSRVNQDMMIYLWCLIDAECKQNDEIFSCGGRATENTLMDCAR